MIFFIKLKKRKLKRKAKAQKFSWNEYQKLILFLELLSNNSKNGLFIHFNLIQYLRLLHSHHGY